MTENIYLPANITVSKEDAEIIISLRLLIARAANKDSLGWWDDESLAKHSEFLLGRIFPIAPEIAARNLALRTASSRHQAACASEPNAIRLFRLDIDNRDELVVRRMELDTIPMTGEPIDTMDILHTKLMQLTSGHKSYKRVRHTPNQGLLIEIPSTPAGISIWQHRAQTLAWAYLESAQNQPVFPFILE